MPHAVADTHALIWYLQDDPQLSATAGETFDRCMEDGGRIRIPAVCVVEIVYLAERGRIPGTLLSALLSELANPACILQLVPIDLAVVLRMRDIPREIVPDMPDRLIAATALHLGLPLITRDRRIVASSVPTIW